MPKRTRLATLATLMFLLAATAGAAACGGEEVATDDGSTSTSGGTAGTAATLDAKTWVVQRISVDGALRPIVQDTTITLDFSAGRLAINAGCNSMSGPTRFDDATLTVSAMGSTEMACDRDRMDQDQFIADFFAQPVTVARKGDAGQLAQGGTTIDIAEQVPEPDVALEGTVWMLDTLLEGDTASSVSVSRRPTLAIDDTGRADVFFGCNSGGGNVEIGDGTLTFGPLAMTRMACEAEAMQVEAAVARMLDGETAYEITGAQLTITKGERGGVWAAQLPD